MPDIRIKGINTIRSKKTGRVYYYDRATGKRLHAPYGTADFLTELETLRAGAGAKVAPPPVAGTWGGLTHAYRASGEFAALAERTRADYNKVFDYLAPLRAVPTAEFDQAYAISIRDRARTRRGWRFANHVLAVLSLTFNWGIPRRLADMNPTEKVPRLRRPRDLPPANPPWTDHELTVVLKAAPTELAVAVALGAYTGLREGDVITLPLTATDGGVIEWRQAKTGDAVDIPVHRDLAPYIRAARTLKQRKATTVVIGKRGLPFTAAGFRARFFKLIRDLRAAGTLTRPLTFHGLRHTVATRLADAGADDTTIQAILGHATTAMSQKYRRQADRKRRTKAAVQLLERRPEKNKKR